MMHGGTHERQRRAGTENVACIAGLGKAAELASTGSPPEGPVRTHCPPRPLRTRHPHPDRRRRSQRQRRTQSLQHQQPLLRSPRSRSSRHRPRPQGHLRQRRLRLPIRRRRTLPRTHRDGPHSCSRTGQHPLLPLPPHHAGRDRRSPQNHPHRRSPTTRTLPRVEYEISRHFVKSTLSERQIAGPQTGSVGYCVS